LADRSRPEGGEAGGRLIAEGTPEEVALVDESYTGQYLRRALPPERLEELELAFDVAES